MQQPAVTATPKPNTNVVIQWESEGDDVKQYQQRLVELGYQKVKILDRDRLLKICSG